MYIAPGRCRLHVAGDRLLQANALRRTSLLIASADIGQPASIDTSTADTHTLSATLELGKYMPYGNIVI